MDFSVQGFSFALPEIVLLCMGLLILMVDVFLPKPSQAQQLAADHHASQQIRWRQQGIIYFLVQLTLVLAFVSALPQHQQYGEPLIAFSGHYILDNFSVLSKLFIYLFSFFAFAYARSYITERSMAFTEYYIFGLFSVLGMSVMVSAYSFLTIFLGLELLSLSLYAMVAMDKKSEFAAEAAMKYFVTGALAAGMFLYGISLLYGITGEIQLGNIAQVLATKLDVVAVVALVFIIAGIIFKFGAVPFHMWVPDVYQGAATPVTLFISTAPKVAAFAITMRILVQALPSLHVAWEQVLTFSAILSMFFGNVLAIAQTNLKRMLAYSSIAHIGYTLLGILTGPVSQQGYSAAMFYIASYVLVAAGAFAIITIMSRAGFECEELQDYRGLNARNPWLAFMMLLLMFSMAGVPPTVGFFAKLGLLQALVDAHMVWLAALALIFALIGAYYYLRVVMLMYFEEPANAAQAARISIAPDMMAAISINGGAALLLGIFPSVLIDLCRISVG